MEVIARIEFVRVCLFTLSLPKPFLAQPLVLSLGNSFAQSSGTHTDIMQKGDHDTYVGGMV